MKKKISSMIAMLLTMCICGGALSACKNTEEETSDKQPNDSTETSEADNGSNATAEETTDTITETETEEPAYIPPEEAEVGVANVALYCPVITNGCINGSNQNLTDGDLNTAWQTGYKTDAAQRTFPYEALIDLTRSYALCGVIIRPSSTAKDATFDTLKVEVSEDGMTYTEAKATAKTTEEGIMVSFDTTARFVKVVSVDLGKRGSYGLEIAEIEVLSAVTSYDNLLPNKRALAMQPGATDLLTAEYRIADEAAGELRFYSTYPKIVSVDEKTGAVTALKNGKATVYVTDGKNATAIPITVKTEDPAYRISVFYPSDQGETSRETMALLQECGINRLECCNAYDSYGNITSEYLRIMAADFGISVLINDPNTTRFRAMSDEEIAAVAAKYKNLPGYAGLYIVDEPLEPTTYTRVYKAIVAEDPFCTPHLNLYPPFDKISDYHGYVTDWVATVGGDTLRLLSYDHYPYLTAKKSFRESVYDSMDEIRKTALMYDNLNTGYYIHAMGIYDAYRVPTDSEILYHVALGIAYGMKDFKYFTWFTPPYSGSGEHFITGILTSEMEKSEMFEGVKAASQMINTLSPILANTDAIEVYHYKGQNGEAIPEDFCITSDKSRIILSLLADRTTGQQYIAVVNKQFYQDTTISLIIQDSSLTELCEVSTGSEKVIKVSDGAVSIKLDAGGLCVFKLPEGYDARQDKDVNDGTKESLLTGIGASVNSSAANGNFAYMLNDGKRTETGWATNFDCETAEIVYDLKTEKSFNRVDIYPLTGSYGMFPKSLSIWVSENGKDYRKVAEAKDIDITKWKALTFETVTARYIRISVDEMVEFGKPVTAIGEIEVYMDKGNIPAMPAFEKPVDEDGPSAYMTPAQAGVVKISYDAFSVDGQMKINDGKADKWLDERENKIDAKNQIAFLGWAGFGEAIESYGYIIDDGEPIWNAGFTTYTEEAVLNFGGQYAKRFNIRVELSGLSGTHTVTFLVKLQDGTMVQMHKPVTVVLP